MTRHRYTGVLTVIEFNWPKYLAALAALMTLMAALETHLTTAALLLSAMAATVWLMMASVLASHWIYDRSDLYRLGWLANVRPAKVERWVTLNAGFDETALGLARRLPGRGEMIDFHDSELMSEDSIARAQTHSKPAPGLPGRSAQPLHLGMEVGAYDLVLVILAAHELRSHHARTAFFHQLRTALRPSGRVIVVEHLRNPANLIVYGPGALHFHTRRTWMGAFAASGLEVGDRLRVTPFVTVFSLEAAC
ncbi:MAG TPA: hypothetical protein VG015_06435 [Candidatus Dormibacteraeota bacterium]|jgi:hypothetical protein|nr:hypothetical protein [Candidatus Dormibacteraeota bacterium]